jgi:hypothetical protein
MSQSDLALVAALLLIPVGLVLLWPATRFARAAWTGRRFARGTCQRCGFVWGAGSPRCPECGTPEGAARAGLGPAGRLGALALVLGLLAPLATGIAGVWNDFAQSSTFAAMNRDAYLRHMMRRDVRSAVTTAAKEAAERPMAGATLAAMVAAAVRSCEESQPYASSSDASIMSDFLTSTSTSLAQAQIERLMTDAGVDAGNFDRVLEAVLAYHDRSPPRVETPFDEMLPLLCAGPRRARSFGTVSPQLSWPLRELTREQEQRIASFVLRRSRDRASPWNRSWGTAFELLGIGGKLSEEQIEAYQAGAVECEMRLIGDRVYAGEAAPVCIVPRWHVGTNLSFEAVFEPDPACAAYLSPVPPASYRYVGTPVIYAFTPPPTPGPFTISGTLTLTFGGVATDGKGKPRLMSDDTTARFWTERPARRVVRKLSTTCTIVVDQAGK